MVKPHIADPDFIGGSSSASKPEQPGPSIYAKPQLCSSISLKVRLEVLRLMGGGCSNTRELNGPQRAL